METGQREVVSRMGGVELAWNPGIECVEYVPERGLTLEEAKAALNRAIQLLKDKKTHKILVDVRAHDRFGPEEGAWVEAEWVPRAVEAGMRVVALVLPKALIAAMEIDKTAGRIDPTATGHKRRMFEGPESARDWLATE